MADIDVLIRNGKVVDGSGNPWFIGDVAISGDRILDITPPGVDKGTFVTALASRLGIATAAIAVIGDMTNDLPMFARAGHAVAMGNAPDTVKATADFVTSSNEEDGFAGAVAEIIRRNRTARV